METKSIQAGCLRARRVPRGEKRRSEIAQTAEAVFLERGYAETTMQIIAERAGASKETLYRHFGCKAELFSEVMRRRSAHLVADAAELRGPPQKALQRFALELIEFLARPDSVRLYRLVVAETAREPELGRIFFENGPGRLLGTLAAYLAAADAAGELSCAEPARAARLFAGSVLMYAQISVLFLGAPLERGDLAAHVREAVDLFLARYADGHRR